LLRGEQRHAPVDNALATVLLAQLAFDAMCDAKLSVRLLDRFNVTQDLRVLTAAMFAAVAYVGVAGFVVAMALVSTDIFGALLVRAARILALVRVVGPRNASGNVGLTKDCRIISVLATICESLEVSECCSRCRN
jgi:hypothetical protein